MRWSRRRPEELRVIWRGFEKTGEKLGPHFVGLGSDHWPQCRDDRLALRADGFHRGNRRLKHAGQRALPARMRSADDPAFRIGEKDDAAVGAGDAEAETARRCDEPVASRPLAICKRCAHGAGVRRMNLEWHEEILRRNAKP